MTIRKAEASDMGAVLRLIKELAVFERAGGAVEITEEQLIHDGFSDPVKFKATLAELEGEVVGMALYYPRYSTWKGVCLYLEDLIVTEACRGMGIGKALLREVAKEADETGAFRVQWQVLDWNAPAIGFYEQIGAFIDKEWYDCKLGREAFIKLINQTE